MKSTAYQERNAGVHAQILSDRPGNTTSQAISQFGGPKPTPVTPTVNRMGGQWLGRISGVVFTVLCFWGLPGEVVRANQVQNRELEIGVVQQFGSKPTDKLILKAQEGDRLYVRFEGGDGTPQTQEVSQMQLEIIMKPLAEPILEERLVLSTHRSFENAEQNADEWRNKGIEVEIAHPGRWQVWAKREVYGTPLLRRFLLQNLQAEGYETAFLDTAIVQQKPQPSWVFEGFRYNRDRLEIWAGTDRIQVSRGKEDRNPTVYPGKLRVQPNAYGTFTLVNKVPIEEYLRGVVPHEIGAEAPYTAVEAQAIIARTYVLRNLRRFAIDNYELCANTECQVYKGIGETWERSDRAIAATAGKVLTYNNELIDALYSSTTGGITAPFQDMWDGADRPYLRAVLDSVGNVWDLSRDSLANEQNFRRFITLDKGFNEEGWDVFRWREVSTLAQMNKNLKDYLQEKQHPQANFQTIQAVEVVERSNAGRAIAVNVTTDQGSVKLVKDEILRAFWAPLSTFFYLERMYGEDKSFKGYVFVGGGFGHGVGLSQSGSHRLAKLGWTSDRILKFYYPGTEIQPVSEDIIFWRDPLAP
ncbi:SpoIID/LytB domain-containing protein [Laspinema olomoucense]|uniref:SpoIID/LytB domain-containing protein n=1 Tax=Laspinema olomoucense TaxID=3231600 RepID=UPI0021BA69F7|nr:SpoIID/LytB domain-containing protein [Laspinema sp. D3a]MCT7989648.1 SpoIID/LytB domain-containing protein [Laspinema sp. D3a]